MGSTSLVSVDNVDWETVILSSNPTFMGLIPNPPKDGV